MKIKKTKLPNHQFHIDSKYCFQQEPVIHPNLT